jgi:hypothetical protein
LSRLSAGQPGLSRSRSLERGPRKDPSCKQAILDRDGFVQGQGLTDASAGAIGAQVDNLQQIVAELAADGLEPLQVAIGGCLEVGHGVGGW